MIALSLRKLLGAGKHLPRPSVYTPRELALNDWSRERSDANLTKYLRFEPDRAKRLSAALLFLTSVGAHFQALEDYTLSDICVLVEGQMRGAAETIATELEDAAPGAHDQALLENITCWRMLIGAASRDSAATRWLILCRIRATIRVFGAKISHEAIEIIASFLLRQALGQEASLGDADRFALALDIAQEVARARATPGFRREELERLRNEIVCGYHVQLALPIQRLIRPNG